MALTDNASIDDVKEMLELESSLTAAEAALLDKIRLRVESLARQYVRHPITEATYTHYLRGNCVYSNVLQLPVPFLSSVTSVYEDYTARGGQGAEDFPAATLLTAGTEYMIDSHDLLLSRQGHVRRINRDWSSSPRTIKVTYVAGLSATHLDNEFLFVKEAIVQESIVRLSVAKGNSGGSSVVGPLLAEKIGDWSARYGEVSSIASWSSKPGGAGLSDFSSGALDPIIFYGNVT